MDSTTSRSSSTTPVVLTIGNVSRDVSNLLLTKKEPRKQRTCPPRSSSTGCLPPRHNRGLLMHAPQSLRSQDDFDASSWYPNIDNHQGLGETAEYSDNDRDNDNDNFPKQLQQQSLNNSLSAQSHNPNDRLDTVPPGTSQASSVVPSPVHTIGGVDTEKDASITESTLEDDCFDETPSPGSLHASPHHDSRFHHHHLHPEHDERHADRHKRLERLRQEYLDLARQTRLVVRPQTLEDGGSDDAAPRLIPPPLPYTEEQKQEVQPDDDDEEENDDDSSDFELDMIRQTSLGEEEEGYLRDGFWTDSFPSGLRFRDAEEEGGGGRQDRDTAPVMIEVAPGVIMPLIGTADKTLEALQSGKALANCNCMNCGLALQCFPLCSHVICPDCRVVSPIASQSATGIGLGRRRANASKR